jgi:hypothetical protein
LLKTPNNNKKYFRPINFRNGIFLEDGNGCVGRGEMLNEILGINHGIILDDIDQNKYYSLEKSVNGIWYFERSFSFRSGKKIFRRFGLRSIGCYYMRCHQ